MRRIIELIKQNRFYSLMMIVSATITITYIMAAFIVSYTSIGEFAPEVNRSRSYSITSMYARNKNKDSNDNNLYGIKGLNRDAIKNIFGDVPSIDFYSITKGESYNTQKFIDDKGKSVDLYILKADENIWKIYDYTFIEGAPFTSTDAESGTRVAVVSELGAQRLLGQKDGVVGKYIEIDGQSEKYRIVGVVENPSTLHINAFAEVIVPIEGDRRYSRTMDGDFGVNIVVREGYDKDDLLSDLGESILRYNVTYLAGSDLQLVTENLDYSLSDHGAETYTYYLIIFLFLVFIIIPSINGLSLSASYISRRKSEIAIRMAYGAQPRQIVWGFIVDNFMITSVGALLGLIASYPFSRMIVAMMTNESGKDIYDAVATLPHEIAFDYRVYLVAVLSNLVFNFFAIYSPARKAVRLSIASSIKGDL